MPSDKRAAALLIVWVLAVGGVAATPGLAVGESLLAAPQDPSAVEASLELQRSTRRLIQQGLHNEGFDPGTPDGLFGPRTRAAIREWQQSRGCVTDGVRERRGGGASANGRRTAARGAGSSAAARGGSRRRPNRLVGCRGARFHAGGERLQSGVASHRRRRRIRPAV